MYENGEGLVGENSLDIHSALDIDVKDNGVFLAPDALHLGFQGAVERTGIDLLIFNEFLLPYHPAELILSEKIILHAILLASSRGARSGRHGKFQFRVILQNVTDYCAFSGS